MESNKEKFIKAVIDQMKFDDISKELGIDRKKVSELYQEYNDEIKRVSAIRKIWKLKFKDNSSINFWDFKSAYEELESKCGYCGITQTELDRLWKEGKVQTKRTRGRKLEIDRKKPDLPYDNLKNLTLSCYWCNNAKTDTFTQAEFERIGKVIGEIWNERLK